MLAHDTTLNTTGNSVVQIQKMLLLCLGRISVWCNANHMLNNPVKSKSRVITTRQKRQLSDLSLRLSLDGQNIENITEKKHTRSRCRQQIPMVSTDRVHMQKHVKNNNCFSFLNCNISTSILENPSTTFS